MSRQDGSTTTQPPRHQVIAQELRSLIGHGTYRLGDWLPTEAQLCKQYKAARGTVRQAMDSLVQLGMIERRPGIGTRVVSLEPVIPYHPFATTPSDVADLVATTRILHPETFDSRLTAAAARRLGVRSGTTWHVLQGVRVLRDRFAKPLCWSEHYFREGLQGTSVSDKLRPEALEGLRIEQTVRAELLEDDLAATLDAEPGTAALVVRRQVLDARGRVLNVGIYTHPADRYEISSSITASP